MWSVGVRFLDSTEHLFLVLFEWLGLFGNGRKGGKGKDWMGKCMGGR